MKQIGIIGGGASGMMAAIAAAAYAKVTILEHTDKLGKKLLATGNGKCNFANLSSSEDDYFGNHPSFVDGALARFGAADMVSFLEEGGVLTTEKRDGYLYPYSGQAATVRSFLVQRIGELGVSVVFGCKVTDVQKENGKFRVVAEDKEYCFDSLILAGGGLAAPGTGSDGSLFSVCKKMGLHIIKQYPVLTQIYAKDAQLKILAGVRANGRATVKIDGEAAAFDEGEIQFNADSLSGIPVFQLCHHATRAFGEGHEVSIWVDFLPAMDAEQARQYIDRVSLLREGISVGELLSGMVNQKIAAAILDRLKLGAQTKAAELGDKQKKKIVSCLHQFVFTMARQSDFDKAQATSGGVSIDEMDENMMVQKCPGLYIVGEMLDVDGKCGGYNLQWAWASGYIAGRHAAGEC